MERTCHPTFTHLLYTTLLYSTRCRRKKRRTRATKESLGKYNCIHSNTVVIAHSTTLCRKLLAAAHGCGLFCSALRAHDSASTTGHLYAVAAACPSLPFPVVPPPLSRLSSVSRMRASQRAEGGSVRAPAHSTRARTGTTSVWIYALRALSLALTTLPL